MRKISANPLAFVDPDRVVFVSEDNFQNLEIGKDLKVASEKGDLTWAIGTLVRVIHRDNPTRYCPSVVTQVAYVDREWHYFLEALNKGPSFYSDIYRNDD